MTYFEINDKDIIHNFDEISQTTGVLTIPTLKANAYGLGAEHVSRLLRDECGVHLFAVSRIEEAYTLCRGVSVLVLSPYHDTDTLLRLVEDDFIIAVDSLSQAKKIGEIAGNMCKRARIHIKIDTGFGRFGFMPSQTSDIRGVFSVENVKVCGIFSHFSSAFAKSPAKTDEQFEVFTSICEQLMASGFDIGLRHIANSSAALRDSKYCLDAVRIGSALTGRVPIKTNTSLRRVGRFYSTICDIRTVKRGANLGYGDIVHLKKNTRVAVLPCGAADGVLIKKDFDTFRFVDFLRYGFHLFKMLFKDNSITARVNGTTVHSVGRPALTHTFFDVTDIDCKAGDRVEFDISPLYVADKVKREYIDV